MRWPERSYRCTATSPCRTGPEVPDPSGASTFLTPSSRTLPLFATSRVDGGPSVGTVRPHDCGTSPERPRDGHGCDSWDVRALSDPLNCSEIPSGDTVRR